jgi:hypothetical protein
MEQRCEVTGSVEEMKRTPPLTPSPVPFVIDVPEDALADLHERLERARLPDWPVGGMGVRDGQGLPRAPRSVLAYELRLEEAGEASETLSTDQDRH